MQARVTTTAYGAPALEALRGAVRDAKDGDPLAAVTVLVPDNLTGLLARRALASGLGTGPGVAGLVVTTPARLAETIAAPRLQPRLPATRAVLAAHWRAALRDEPGVFGPVADHPATVRALAAAHRELRDAGERAADDVAGTSPLAADLVRLHRAVAARVSARWYDETDLLRDAARALADDAAARPRAVVLYAPGRLTGAEQTFVGAVAAAVPLTVVLALTGVRRADGPVLDSLRAAGVAVPEVGKGERFGPRPAVATGVRHASDADDEVRLVARELVETLETVPAHRVSVLYAGTVPYARLLHERLAAVGVRVNGAGARAVHERALPRAFLGLLRLATGRLRRAELFDVLSDAPLRTSAGEPVPVARWEHVSRLAAVVEGEDWDARLAAWAQRRRATAEAEEAADDPRPAVVERARRDAEVAESLRTEVLALAADLRAGAACATWGELSEWALELLERRYGSSEDLLRLPPEERYAAAALESAVRELAALGDVEPAADLELAAEVLTAELERAVPRVGRFGEGVYVGPLGECAVPEADVVFVVGLAEDSYPGRVRVDALLGDDVRAATAALAPSRAPIDDRQRALLAALAAAPRVVASFPRGDLRRSADRQPSRWLLPTLRDLARDDSLAVSDWPAIDSAELWGSPSFASSLVTAPFPADEQEWRVRAAAAGGGGDDVVAASRNLLAARAGHVLTRFDGDLSGVGGLPDHATGAPVVSPTSLEAYAECPHAWFVSRMLRVQPLELPEEIVTITPLEIGTLLHACLDRLVRSAARLPTDGAPWSAQDRALLRDIFAEEAQRARERGSTGHPRLWDVERERLLADLEGMLDDDDAWRAERSASVLASELTFGAEGVEPVRIPVPRGAVAFRGSADKVDRAADGTLLVTDVKTGGPSKYVDIERGDPIVHGTRLQLPVYAHAARAAFPAAGPSRVEAMYWFVRRGGKRIRVELDEALAARFSGALGVLTDGIARGTFPAIAPDAPDFAWVQCPYCNPDGLGHAEVRERWERQRHDPRLAELVALVDPAAAGEDG